MYRIAITSALWAFVLSSDARAHAFLDHADPRVGSTVLSAPRALSLSFTQNLEPAFSGVEVSNASGARVDQGRPQINGSTIQLGLKSLTPGTYHVRWHVLSVDTHKTQVVSHSVSVSDHKACLIVTDPLIGVRAVHFVAAMLVAGIAVFEVLVIVPAMREIEWPSVEAMTRLRTRLVDIIWAGLAVAVFSGAAWLLFLAARIADRSPIEVLTDGTAWTVLSQTRFGVDWQVRYWWPPY